MLLLLSSLLDEAVEGYEMSAKNADVGEISSNEKS